MIPNIISSKNTAYLIAIFLGLFILFSPPTDADFGWHYKYGEYIANNQQIPKHNFFSFTFEDYVWADSYWLSQVIIYSIGSTAGFTVLATVTSFLLIGSCIYLLKAQHTAERETHITVQIVPLLIFFLAMEQFHITTRPMFFSTILALLLVHIIEKKKQWLGITPILFLVWANLHADFVLGLLIFSMYIFTKIYERKIRRAEIIAFLISIGATLINPNGILLYTTLLKETHPFQFLYIQEWQPLWHVNKAILIFVIGITLFNIVLWRTQSLFSKIAVGFFLLLTMRFGYFSRIYIVISFFCFVSGWEYLWSQFSSVAETSKVKYGKVIIRISIFLLVPLYSLIFFQKVNLANSISRWSKAGNYPYQAVEFIKTNNIKGNIFNTYSWGGYLIWHLPENKVFIDGRMPSWRVGNRSVFEDYIKFVTNPNESFVVFETYRKMYDFDYALLNRESTVSSFLISKGWEILYSDEISILLVAPKTNYDMAKNS